MKKKYNINKLSTIAPANPMPRLVAYSDGWIFDSGCYLRILYFKEFKTNPNSSALVHVYESEGVWHASFSKMMCSDPPEIFSENLPLVLRLADEYVNLLMKGTIVLSGIGEIKKEI
jgi:hypothetical protein